MGAPCTVAVHRDRVGRQVAGPGRQPAGPAFPYDRAVDARVVEQRGVRAAEAVGRRTRPPSGRRVGLARLAGLALAVGAAGLSASPAGAAASGPSQLGQTRALSAGAARVQVRLVAVQVGAPELRGAGAPNLLPGAGPFVALEVSLHNTSAVTATFSAFTVTLDDGGTGSAEAGNDRGTTLRPWLDVSSPLAPGATRRGWTTMQGAVGSTRSVHLTLDGKTTAVWSLR